jgi:hypothetical protein
VFKLARLIAGSVIGVVALLCATTVVTVLADGCGNGQSPDRRLEGAVGGWGLDIEATHGCRGDVIARVEAIRRTSAGAPNANSEHPLGPSGIFSVPIYCRRDDYMFLPPTSVGGLPCADVASQDRIDPLALALEMEAQLPPPDLRIGMNPARGMVAVPTWFWVDGYDGGVLSQSEQVLESHEECHLVANRDETGHAVLGSEGRPQTHQDCTVKSSTFTIDVRLWPGRFAWDFGDSHGREVACPGMGDCGDALGQPFMDLAHPSPVQHPYRFSSLGINGAQDAYTIRLGVTFNADYRVSVDGAGGGWRALPGRVLTWTANHQVQEAQAVLTRP